MLLPLHAQVTGIGSAKTWVFLNFEQNYGIYIADASVNLNLNTPEDFMEGTATDFLSSHLKVVSRGGYEVWVKAASEDFYVEGTPTGIPVNAIKINTRNSVGTASVSLSSVSQLLIGSNKKKFSESLDVNYEIPSDRTDYFFNQSGKVYETVIIYTLILN